MTRLNRQPRIGIVGAGMSGLCLAAVLTRAGIPDVTILEKASRLGGTWRDNTYPGLACDVPSRFYQFTFAPNPDWTHGFSPGQEIWDYFERVADDLDLRRLIRFDTEVTGAVYDEQRKQWDVTVSVESGASVETFDFLITATGILHHPRYPSIPGLEDFQGAVFHSARWDHSVPLEGRRVAVVGTGSTGVQIVCGLAGTTSETLLFCRNPQWIVTMPNRRNPEWWRAAHRRIPALNQVTYRARRIFFEVIAESLVKDGVRRRAFQWAARRSLAQVKDPELRRRLTPTYEPLCKRMIFSPDFYDVIQAPGTTLVDAGIDHVESDAIVTSDGVRHEVDVIALATGFDAHAFLRPMELTGPGGRSLADAWSEGPQAYHTVSLPGFPNFFLMMGPHSPVGNYSLTAIAESQADHILTWVRRWQGGEFEAVAPTQEATDAFNAQMRDALPGTVWVTGCDSWYLGQDGLPELFPWKPQRHRELLTAPDDSDHVFS